MSLKMNKTYMNLMEKKDAPDSLEISFLLENISPDQKRNAALLFLHRLADRGMSPKEIVNYISNEDD